MKFYLFEFMRLFFIQKLRYFVVGRIKLSVQNMMEHHYGGIQNELSNAIL